MIVKTFNNTIDVGGSISVLIKPTDACNLRCIYCYHSSGGYEKNLLELSTLEIFYLKCFSSYKNVNIIWHGGEPTYVGLDYYKSALEMQEKYVKQYGTKVRNSIQTNGTYINQDWIDFFIKYKIHVGISFDAVVNDITRKSTQKVLNIFNLLKINKITFGTICVVSQYNVEKLVDSYLMMNKLNIPVKLNHYIEVGNCNSNLNMDVNNYVAKMFELFEYWVNYENCTIRLDPFSLYVREALTGHSNICCRQSCLRCWIGLNPSGEIAPCSRYYPSEYTYGNIKELEKLQDIYLSDGFYRMLLGAVARRDKCKSSCQLYDICQGGCNSSAMMEGSLEDNGGFTCLAYKGLMNLVARYLKVNDINTQNYQQKFLNPKLIHDLDKVI